MKHIFLIFICLFSKIIAQEQYLEDVKKIAIEAGKKVLEIREAGEIVSQDVVLSNGKKIHQTNANIVASEYILEKLFEIAPYGLLSHDQMDKDRNWYRKHFVWIVNPIDGVREYEKGGDEFHIQIGLLAGDESVLGVSYYPAKNLLVWAALGQGAWMEREGVIQKLVARPSQDLILIKSSSHATILPLLQERGWIPEKVLDECLSSTSRLLKIIEGDASLYISLGASKAGRKKKGSICNYGANSIIAKEAGLILSTLDGRPLNLREPSALLIDGVRLS